MGFLHIWDLLLFQGVISIIYRKSFQKVEIMPTIGQRNLVPDQDDNKVVFWNTIWATFASSLLVSLEILTWVHSCNASLCWKASSDLVLLFCMHWCSGNWYAYSSVCCSCCILNKFPLAFDLGASCPLPVFLYL